MGHIFISYSHKDQHFVEKLEKKLIDEGFDVWTDHRIDYGTQWPKEIEKALDACDAFIVIVSENSYESEWVQAEVARARRKRKSIFPLLLQGEIWLGLEALNYVDVKDGFLPPEKFYNRLDVVVPHKKNSVYVEKRKSPLEKQHKKSLPLRISSVALIVVLFFGGMYLGGAFGDKTEQANTFPATRTSFTEVTSTSTPIPTSSLIAVLNKQIIDSNPLQNMLSSKYYVVDLYFPSFSGDSPLLVINVNCETVGDSSCSIENALAILGDSRGFEAVDQVFDGNISALAIHLYEDYEDKGYYLINWTEIANYIEGEITVEQFVVRLATLETP